MDEKKPAVFEVSDFDLALLYEILEAQRSEYARQGNARLANDSLHHLISETSRLLKERGRS